MPQIIERTKNEHADDTPQVIALEVTDANPGYRDWLHDVTGGRAPTS